MLPASSPADSGELCGECGEGQMERREDGERNGQGRESGAIDKVWNGRAGREGDLIMGP